MPNVLEIENLCVRYGDGVDALRGVSLALAAGERVGKAGSMLMTVFSSGSVSQASPGSMDWPIIVTATRGH